MTLVTGSAQKDTKSSEISVNLGSSGKEIIAKKSELTAEEEARIAGDASLQSDIDAEITTREAADTFLQNNIDAEEDNRIAGDAALQSDIDTESATRAYTDTTLQGNINSEASARASADSDLQTDIGAEETARMAADATETSARFAADGVLQNNINTEAATRATNDNTLETNLSQEAVTRAATDANLLAQIVALQNAAAGTVPIIYNSSPGWTNSTTYVNTALAGKTFELIAIGNTSTAGMSYTKQWLLAGVDYSITPSGGFTLLLQPAQNNDKFLVLGSGVQPANVLGYVNSDGNVSFVDPNGLLIWAIEDGQQWPPTPRPYITYANLSSALQALMLKTTDLTFDVPETGDHANLYLPSTSTIVTGKYINSTGKESTGTGYAYVNIPILDIKNTLWIQGLLVRNTTKIANPYRFVKPSDPVDLTQTNSGTVFGALTYGEDTLLEIPVTATNFLVNIKFPEDLTNSGGFISYLGKPKIIKLAGYKLNAGGGDGPTNTYSQYFYEYNPTGGVNSAGRMSVYTKLGDTAYYNQYFVDKYIIEPTVRANLYRITGGVVSFYDGVGMIATSTIVLTDGENEFAIKEVGTVDHTGGYHGDEKFTRCIFFADGLPILDITRDPDPLTNVQTFTPDNNAKALTACTSFFYTEALDMYQTQLTGFPFVYNKIYDHQKLTTFIPGGYNTRNGLDWLPAISTPKKYEAIYNGLVCLGYDFAKYYYTPSKMPQYLTNTGNTIIRVEQGNGPAYFYNPTTHLSAMGKARMLKLTASGVDITDHFNKELVYYDQRNNDENSKFYFRTNDSTGGTESYTAGDRLETECEVVFYKQE